MSSSSLSRDQSPFSEDELSSITTTESGDCGFSQLPPELRLKIWSCAVEPRIIILDDLMCRPRSYPIPAVAQLNIESRTESMDGYEGAGQGSHVHFARDILVCDPTISEKTADPALEAVAGRIQRVAFWDCFPDDRRIEIPYRYSSYLSACYEPNHGGTCPIICDKLWFPNLKELWIVKVGHLDKAWLIDEEENMSFDIRLRQTARTFRYWVNQGVVEMAPLSIEDPDTKLVLQQGRCSKEDCRELNRRRALMITKVLFSDEDYSEAKSSGWRRILPWPASTAAKSEEDDSENWKNEMRWIVVERALTFSLRWDWPRDPLQESRRRQQCITTGTE